MHRFFTLLLLLVMAPQAVRAAVSQPSFEGRLTHPIALSPDGKLLVAVNPPAGRLSVFDVSNPARQAPLLIAEIPAGLEPVSVRHRTADEVWVVNEVSDSVSVVSLSRRVVVATLQVPDEPADVVFAGDNAFVVCARNSLIRIFDSATRTPAGTIPLEGNLPRSLTVSRNGRFLYVACLLSGNQTTILPAHEAPPPAAPSLPDLPPTPRTALIVPANDPRIPYTVLDHDVAEIHVESGTVSRWFSGIGTHLFDVAQHPLTGDLWVPNSHSLNLTATEPALKGHFIDHRITKIILATGAAAVHDLNPGIDYGLLPNPEAKAQALAHPASVVFAPDGSSAWIAAFNSDRLARMDPDGQIIDRLDLRLPLPPGSASENNSRFMRGPRGLVMNAAGSRLYVLNSISWSITVVDSQAATVLAEVPLASQSTMPAAVREARGFLYDARLSGNGTASCASCHLDADTDGLAWDLGNPGGALHTVDGQNLSVHDFTVRPRVMHPMKGPMLTQTLRGLQPGQKLHWRGDRAGIQDFNPTFRDLMGGSLIAAEDMIALGEWLLTLRHHPNPNRLPDNSRPGSLEGGDANAGRLLYLNHERSHCAVCHTLPTGSDDNIDLMQEVNSTQPVRTPPLRTVYQRAAFQRTPGSRNVSGFGLLKDGTGTFASLPTTHEYALSDFRTAQQLADVRAFVLSFDTGTPPITGYSLTLNGFPDPGSQDEVSLNLLESRASTAGTNPEVDLVVHGIVRGNSSQFLWDRGSQRYLPDRTSAASLTRALLLSSLQTGDVLTFSATLPSFGSGRARDRNADGIADGDEPAPEMKILKMPATLQLDWASTPSGWFPEYTNNMENAQWSALTEPAVMADGRWVVPVSPSAPNRFFRLRRTW